AALRTPEFLLVALGDVRGVYPPHPPAPWAGKPDSFNTYDRARAAVVETLADRRAEALKANGDYPTCPARGLAGGALLAFNPMTLHDEAAVYYSCGFFDEEDEPPWDTWLWYINEPGPTFQMVPGKAGPTLRGGWSFPYVVSWVPPRFIKAVHESKDLTSLGTIEWLALIDGPFTRRLRRLGLLDPTQYS
ncbi:MAG: hypothetical protein LC772_04045, partial [Chloroflexi bacterium]|nr:hypothetical protein [Chloroflexota bacterium]